MARRTESGPQDAVYTDHVTAGSSDGRAVTVSLEIRGMVTRRDLEGILGEAMRVLLAGYADPGEATWTMSGSIIGDPTVTEDDGEE